MDSPGGHFDISFSMQIIFSTLIRTCQHFICFLNKKAHAEKSDERNHAGEIEFVAQINSLASLRLRESAIRSAIYAS